MKDMHGQRFGLGSVLAAFALAACSSGATTPSAGSFTSSPLALYSHGVAVRPDHQRSWLHVKRDVSKLLYVSDDSTDDVQVYDYPAGTLVGTLTGFATPGGLCVDPARHILFVTNTDASNIYVFKFGATSPFEIIPDTGEYPVSCSIDPANGHLAVANYETTGGTAGSISIYPPPFTTSTVYADPSMKHFYFVGYRPNGRLYADGINTGNTFQLDRFYALVFATMALTPGITTPGNVQWSGTTLVVGDQTGNLFYRYTIAGLTGTAPPASTFTAACDVLQFFINGAGAKIVGPDNCGAPPNAYTYAFPAGGAAIAPFVTTALVDPVGSAILSP
ncbi:MAG TPA: hypothetical protein VGX91_11860 [Candidatus Cybelea sp.]|jgi:hypothetical protein|nr:hypothetical protein [Candidatus Cybelea sp.]